VQAALAERQAALEAAQQEAQAAQQQATAVQQQLLEQQAALQALKVVLCPPDTLIRGLMHEIHFSCDLSSRTSCCIRLHACNATTLS
jgi:hypothetical protein